MINCWLITYQVIFNQTRDEYTQKLLKTKGDFLAAILKHTHIPHYSSQKCFANR